MVDCAYHRVAIIQACHNRDDYFIVYLYYNIDVGFLQTRCPCAYVMNLTRCRRCVRIPHRRPCGRCAVNDLQIRRTRGTSDPRQFGTGLKCPGISSRRRTVQMHPSRDISVTAKWLHHRRFRLNKQEFPLQINLVSQRREN